MDSPLGLIPGMSSAAGGNSKITDMESQSNDECEEHKISGRELDSSNDEAVFRDSSNDEDETYNDSEPHTLKIKHLNQQRMSDSQNSSEESTVTDEAALMLMSTAEQQYYDQYLNANLNHISSLKCTTCSCQLFLASPEQLRIHPALGNCRDFYSKGPFTKDSTGHDEYCRWCAEGGIVICCDTCSNVFCKACLRRCIGRAALSELSNSDKSWSCLLCNNERIWAQRAQCRLAFSMVQKQSRNRCKSASSRLDGSPIASASDDPAVWLPAMLNQAERLATQFKLLIAKVGTNWTKKDSKSDIESANIAHPNPTEEEKQKIISCCRKLRKAIVTNRFNMKVLEKKLVTKYTRKFKNAAEIELDVASTSGRQGEDSSPHGKRLVMKIKNFREGKRRNSYYAEIDGQKSTDETTSRKSVDSLDSIATVPMSQSLSNSVDRTSHGIEVEEAPCLSTDKKLVEQVQGTSLQHQPENSPAIKIKEETKSSEPQKHSETTITSINSAPNTGHRSVSAVSKLKFHSSPNFEKLRKDLLKDSSEDSDDFAESNTSPRIKRTRKRNRSVPSDLENDPKLKVECAVVLNRLQSVQDVCEIKETMRGSSDDAAIDRKINRLLGSVCSSSKKLVHDSDESQSGVDKKLTKKNGANICKEIEKKKAFRLSDLGSSSESSDSETSTLPQTANHPVLNPAKPTMDTNEAVRQALLDSSSSDTEPMNDLDEETQGPETVVKTEAHPDYELPVVFDEIEIELSNDIKVEKIDESPDVTKDRKAKERDRSLSPETAKLLHDPITKGNKKTNEEEDVPADNKRKSRDKRKRRIVDSDSDFQSSGSGTEQKQKPKRKKPQPSDDDFEDEETSDSKPKRRRRIKKVASSDSEASDDSDVQVLNESQRSDPGSANKGRKNIKRIIKDQNLKDETKAAAKEEEERKKRIAERQKMYNKNFVGDIALESAKIDKLVLDFDPKTKQELVTVDNQLVTKLKPHQVKGVKFMWDACFESIERIKEHPGSGCILAHCMGLGKSLQVVTLSHTVLTHKDCQVERVMVVCPLSTVLNWQNEFNIWLPDSSVPVYELASAKTNELRVSCLRNWMETGGVMIIGYDMYRNLSNEQNKRIKAPAKARETFQRSLVDPGPQLVVCDEGHLLKNEATALSKAMNRIATKRRIVLTGTPLQNSLLEYHCMIQFVKPNLLGTKKEFTNRFANPIKNGQAADSTDGDVRVMKRRAHVLHKMLEDSVQRFDYSVLTPFLPPKYEYVVSVKMSDLQIKMYQYYLEKHAKGVPGFVGRGKGAGLFADFQELGRVWTHPRAMMLAQLRRELKAGGQSDTDGSMADFIDDRGTPTTEDEGGVVCLDDSDEVASDAGEIITRKPRTRASRGDQPPPEDQLGVTVPMGGSWWSQFVTDDDMTVMEHSGKLVILMDILRQCELIGDKVLVFSQSLVSLDLIEEFLQMEDDRNEKNRASLGCDSSSEKVDHIGSWLQNVDYFRLDGQTTPELRKNWCNTFNCASNTRARLFLISTKAGGLGINLVAANRVIIFDASWNPSHDVQSIFRVYRFGQKKPCYIYRFLAQGTMEEKIYDRQVTKLSLSCRVVDEQQIERHFNSADLNELYVFEPDSHLRRPTPLLPKDRLLAELTIQRKEWIVTYHEHDSLLENKAEEELTEAERKAAWDDFENEKRGYSQFGNNTSVDPLAVSHFGIPGMAEVFASLAGRSVAGIPLSNIAAMIYNSNPGISQDEFLGRLRLTVDQLQNFSVQQATASAPTPAPVPSVQPPSVQQPGDAQRLIMQRQVAQDQLKRQFGNAAQSAAVAGPSGVSAANPLLPVRSRGRPTIGPHQRTDIYGLGPVIAASAQQGNIGAPPTGKGVPPKT